jgi:hypothetical protein
MKFLLDESDCYGIRCRFIKFSVLEELPQEEISVSSNESLLESATIMYGCGRND